MSAMRRLLACLALASIVGGATLGLAAGLDLPRSHLAAGSAPVVACDVDGIDVRYALGWQNQVTIERVTIAGIDDACVGLSITVVLVVAGEPIEIGPTRIARDDLRRVVVRLKVPGVVPALELERTHVAIT
jgi:hypothetical protein